MKFVKNNDKQKWINLSMAHSVAVSVNLSNKFGVYVYFDGSFENSLRWSPEFVTRQEAVEWMNTHMNLVIGSA